MRILHLIMVGAFLLSIAIADNGNSMRSNTRNLRSHLTYLNTINRGFTRPKVTRLGRRVSRTGHVFSLLNDINVADNAAISTDSTKQYAQDHSRESKSSRSMDNAIILQPVSSKPCQSSWTDWIPDFFGDDTQPSPGPLIGLIDIPGMGSKVYIRPDEPIDDDIDHVVIHLVNREENQQHNQLPYKKKDLHQLSHRHTQRGKSASTQDDDDKDELPSKSANVIPWKLNVDLPNKKGENRDFANSTSIGVIQMPNEDSNSKFTVVILKQDGSEQPNVVWSQNIDRQSNYERNVKTFESSDSDTFASNADSDSHSNDTLSYSDELTAEQYESLRRNGYRNDTRARSESPAAGIFQSQRNRVPNEIQRFQPAINYLDEITLANKADLSRRRANNTDARYRVSLNDHSRYSSFSDVSLRTPRNRYSATKPFAKVRDFKKFSQPQRGTPISEIGNGGLRVVLAPNLHQEPERDTGTDVLQNIMTMTANQTWGNVTSRSPEMIEAKKSTDFESKQSTTIKPVTDLMKRRVSTINDDDENEETKETERSGTIGRAGVNKVNKSEAKMKEAVQKMMSSFRQWRHKVVTTHFLKELDRTKKKTRSKWPRIRRIDRTSHVAEEKR